MVYEKLLLLIVAVATKWRVVAFLIDIYIYRYIKNIRHVRKCKHDE